MILYKFSKKKKYLYIVYVWNLKKGTWNVDKIQWQKFEYKINQYISKVIPTKCHGFSESQIFD